MWRRVLSAVQGKIIAVTQIRLPRQALADGVREVATTVEAAGHANDWGFLSDSPAVTDWTANEQPSGWGPQPLQDAYRTGALGWYVVVEQALAVADLLDTGRNLGLLAASRALAEASARSELLLRPDTAPEVRIRRMINERLHALHEDWRYTSDVPELDSSWQMPTANKLLDVAEQEFILTVQRPNERRPGWVEVSRESTMKVLGDMIGHPKFAAMFYRNTSAISHAALNGLAKRLELVERPTDIYRARLREVSSQEATLEVQPALTALLVVSRTLLAQTGWDKTEFERAEADLLTLINGIAL